MPDSGGHDAGAASQMPEVSLQRLTERMRHHNERRVRPQPVVVEDVVVAVLDTMDGRLSSTEALLLHEIAGLGRIIEQAKADIAQVNLGAIRGSHIPAATDELDAIVEHTDLATNSILETCEILDALTARLDGPLDSASRQVLTEATTRIYEACSFQDITGQRIAKVVSALQAIEAKVVGLSGACLSLGVQRDMPHDPASAATRPEPRGQGGDPLLQGPRLPHEAMGQADIDKLLAGP